MTKKLSIVCGMVLVFMLLVELSFKVDAVNCDPEELRPCFRALTGDVTPSGACCRNLKEQQPCICKYRLDPKLGMLANSTRARIVAASCAVLYPVNCKIMNNGIMEKA
ncbi:unnamed protein product [Lupinus luteus]|uniref:Bifunctional inhibitor/plant lipid transfer protein/seed storage helical domain-containing protein n=1 Tax=Lupinus luteus TaxID=3873 RepID=A0AAV1XWT2_LUPLU